MDERYARQVALIDREAQKQLREARILMVGMGGLGCPALQYLAGAGIGTLTLVDGDRVQAHNLPRQILYNAQHIGKSKAACAGAWARAHNPEVEVRVHDAYFTAENAIQLVQQHDLVIDGTDNFQTKYLINDACVLENRPMVYASVYKYEGQLSVFNYQGGPTYRCLFPSYHARDINNCEETGVLGPVPGLLGVWQAMEALKVILGKDSVLSGQLKVIDLLRNEERMVSFVRDEARVKQVLAHGLQIEKEICLPTEHQEKIIVDIRESGEVALQGLANTLHIPFSQFTERFEEIPRDREVLLVCQTGKRSARALQFLKSQGFIHVEHQEGGITHAETP